MCTVSFVRVNDAVIITSNRDEHIQRANAAAPAFHLSPHKKIIFPKDAKAGGTWFAASDIGVVAVLLNGAVKKHIAKPPYRKSRGLILLEIIEADSPLIFFKEMDLDNIEPFTVILYQPGSLHELRWDGSNKYDQLLDDSGSYIWSSSTLYTDEVIGERKNLFDRFIKTQKNVTAELIHDFHGYDNGDAENGFVISRQTGMKTFSITQAEVKPGSIRFSHTDLLQQKAFEESMHINQATINS
ncbi:MAG: NRDE family protein [Ferruginibacter sp.]